LVGADNIGYIIPPPVINHFLTQYHIHKKYTGFPQLGIQWQTLENNSLRNFYQLDSSMTGVLVTWISPVSPANGILLPEDVILSINNIRIANNGTVDFYGGERVFLNYLFVHNFVGEKCEMQVLRKKEIINLSFPLISSTDLALVPAKNVYIPEYLVYGGFVFTKLTIQYLREFESEDQDNWYDAAPRTLVHKALHGFREESDQEVVILSHVLADDLNYGYTHMYNVELEKFNGVKVRNLKHLDNMIHSSNEPFAKFNFADKTIALLETRQVKKRNKGILRHYAISAAQSENFILNKKVQRLN